MILSPLIRSLSAGRKMIPPLGECTNAGSWMIHNLDFTPPRRAWTLGEGVWMEGTRGRLSAGKSSGCPEPPLPCPRESLA